MRACVAGYENDKLFLDPRKNRMLKDKPLVGWGLSDGTWLESFGDDVTLESFY